MFNRSGFILNISIIGAGIGGLSAACLLASKGHKVSIFEKNNSFGGKMNLVEAEGYRFDTGPSLFTMPETLEALFTQCGTSLAEQLTLLSLSTNCRYTFADGTRFDNHHSLEATLEEIKRIAPKDLEAYKEFLSYSENLFHKTEHAFIRNPLFDMSDFKNLDLLSFFKIDAFTTVSKRVDSYFKSPYLRQFFKRFTTYNGSSPFLAPATLNVIPHIELNQGGYYVKGGLFKIVEALYNLVLSLGVEIHFDSEIKQIHTESKRVSSIELISGEKVSTSLIVANSDATETITRMFDESSISHRKQQKAKAVEPSCSGFVLLLGINKKYEQLLHHNIFFSKNYEREFEDLFVRKVMPEDPTIYIANTSFTDKEHAPEGSSNLFVLVNAPYLSDSFDWKDEASKYTDRIISILEEKGLTELSSSIQFQEIITPQDFYTSYRSNKGSIYGTSSNSKFSAFVRPHNKSKMIDGLYFVGGSSHPGGGIPLVIQSAFNAVQLIERYE